MGGTKKKSLSSSKSQDGSSPQVQTEKKDEKKPKGKGSQKSKVTVLLDEKQGLKALAGLKAVTPQALARNLGVKISVANAYIRSLESQGSVKQIGGYSGHRVYQLLLEVKPDTKPDTKPDKSDAKSDAGEKKQ
ncbi:MAG: small subunit ribosomal protein S25e [Candidatus Nitrosomirales archaeon]|jgi:small subunit ribosomal protein S25e